MGQNKQTGHVHVAHRVLCTFEHIFGVILLQSQKEIHCYLAVSTFISWSRLRLRYVSLSCRIFSKCACQRMDVSWPRMHILAQRRTSSNSRSRNAGIPENTRLHWSASLE